MACLMFNTALEKIIRDAAVNIRGAIFYKSVRILAYADDIDTNGRTQSAMIEAFTSLEKAAKSMNLFINQENTTYMPVTKKSQQVILTVYKLDHTNFKLFIVSLT